MKEMAYGIGTVLDLSPAEAEAKSNVFILDYCPHFEIKGGRIVGRYQTR